MDRHARTPEPLSNDGNMADNWRTWREDFLIFMTVTEYNKKPNEMKASLMKNLIGKHGLAAINSFTFNNPSDKDDLGILLSKLDLHFDPPKTETELRYKFFTRTRQNKESIEEYINDLRERAKVCKFGSLTESLIRDKAILDTKDKSLRKKYMEAKSLTVNQLILMCKEHEAIVQKMTQISKGNDGKSNTTPGTSSEKKTDNCWRCGRKHPIKNCAAFGVKCEKCNDKNHFTHCCPKNKGNEKNKDFNKNLFDSFYLNNTSGKANATVQHAQVKRDSSFEFLPKSPSYGNPPKSVLRYQRTNQKTPHRNQKKQGDCVIF